MHFIDAHTHAYTEADLGAIKERHTVMDGSLAQENPHRWRLHHKGDLASLAQAEKEAGVGAFVLLPGANRPEKVGPMNHWACRAARDHPGLIPFATLHPLAESPLADLTEALVLGLKGVKLHTIVQRFTLTDEKSLKLIEAVDAAGLPLLIDTLHGPGLLAAKPHLAHLSEEFSPFATTPDQIAQVAGRFPGLKIIAAHLGCLYGWDLVEPLFGQSNVYFDLSYVDRLLPPDEALSLIRGKGVKRVLWGTDSPWREIRPAREWFETLDLDQEEKRLIAAGNLTDLLGL